MPTATVTSKGQIVIPVKIRRRLGIEKGTCLYLEERGGEIVLRPINQEYLDKVAGVLKGPVSLSRKLLKERAADREREK